MKFDYLGRPVAPKSGVTAFRMTQIIVLFWLLVNLAIISAFHVKWRRGMELSNADIAALILVNGVMLVYSIFATSSTRSSLREKYMIREHRLYDLEDFFCASFCMPCTICQMNRHTASFVDYDAVWCSETGLPDGVDIDQQPRQQRWSSKTVDKYLV
jgi:Cys-rich protein (TIGR01571 family)